MKQGPASKIFVLSFMFLLVTGTMILVSMFSTVSRNEMRKALIFLDQAESYSRVLGYSSKASGFFRELKQKVLTSEKGKDILRIYRSAYGFLIYITVIRALEIGLLVFAIPVIMSLIRLFRVYYPALKLRLRSTLIRRRERLTDHPVDRAISMLKALLDMSDVPASIEHHGSVGGGLRAHTIRVAERAVKIFHRKYNYGNGRPPVSAVFPGVPLERLIYLLALAHDIGKIRTYEAKSDGKTFRSLVIPLLSQTSLLFAYILRKAGLGSYHIELLVKSLDPGIDDLPLELLNLRSILKEADQTTVSHELAAGTVETELKDRHAERIPKGISFTSKDLVEDPAVREAVIDAFYAVLEELNINGIYGTNYDGWYNPEQDILALNVWKLATKVTFYLQENYPHLPVSKYQAIAGSQKLHPVVPLMSRVLERAGILLTEYEGIPSERYLFNIRAGTVKFKAIYLIRTEKIPQALLKRWGDEQSVTIFPVKVLQRKPRISPEE